MSVADSWKQANGNNDAFAKTFGEFLHEASSEVSGLLKQDGVKVLIAAIDAGVNSNDSGVKDNAKKLSSFGINDSHYDAFGFALLGALEKVVPNWNAQLEESWGSFVEQLTGKMKSA